MSIALASLIEKTKEDKVLLEQILSSFSCVQDEDIENFLHKRAVPFEELSKSRTYLICDQEQMESNVFSLEQLQIYGYISLALKVLSVPDNVSNNRRKDIDGLSAKIHGEVINDFACYLIGQLSKNSNVTDNVLSGNELLQIAFSIIADAVELVGGRYMMIECHNNEKLINFYSRNGFEKLSCVSDDNIEMVQMIRKIS